MNRREATGMAQEAAARLEGYVLTKGPMRVGRGLINDMREIMGMVRDVADWIDDNQEKADEAVGLLKMVSRHAQEIATKTDHKLLLVTLEAIRRLAMDGIRFGQPQRDQAEQRKEEKIVTDTSLLLHVYDMWNGEIWRDMDAVEFCIKLQTGKMDGVDIIKGNRTKMRKVLGGIRQTIADPDKAKQWWERVKQTIGIDATRSTPTVTYDEKINSAEMKIFGRELEEVFGDAGK